MIKSIRVWFVISSNWFSYLLLVVKCELLTDGRQRDRNNVRWVLRNFIAHCSNRGMNPFNSTTEAYRKHYSFTIRGVVGMRADEAVEMVRQVLIDFDSTHYTSSMFVQ